MFAGPGRRAVAALIDAFIVAALVLLSMPLPGLAREFLPSLPADAPLFLLPLVLPILYLVLFPVTRAEATPGKRACGIKIATRGGDRIGLARSIVRFVASLVSIATLFLGCLLMVWNRKHRALHDFVAGTVVVDARARPPEIAWSEAAPASWTWRFAGTGAYVAVAALLVLLYRGPMHGDLASEVNEHNMSQALPVVAALDAYREKNGRYPETLQALSPAYIGGMPHLIATTGLGFASTAAGDRCWLTIVYWKEAGLLLPSDRVYEYDCRTREWASLDYNDMHATAASR